MTAPTTQIDGAKMTDDTIDAVSKALRRAWQLGQTYWQQADSDSWKQQDKSNETQKKFEALVDETRALLASKTAVPEGFKLVPVEPTREMIDAGFKKGTGARHVYAAMLAASPTAPAQPCGEDAAEQSDSLQARFKWPKMPGLPTPVMYSPKNGVGLFTGHQMQGYANAYGEAVRVVALPSAAEQADAPRANSVPDCPHAAPFRYCPQCVVSPCPIGLGDKK